MGTKTIREIDRIKENINRTVRERGALIGERLALMESRRSRRRRWPLAVHARRGYVDGGAGLFLRLLAIPFTFNDGIRERFISYGLRHKAGLNKIPLFNNAFKRLYRSLR